MSRRGLGNPESQEAGLIWITEVGCQTVPEQLVDRYVHGPARDVSRQLYVRRDTHGESWGPGGQEDAGRYRRNFLLEPVP